MAVPRPIVLLAALGAVLLALTFYTVRGARQDSQSDQISKAVQASQPEPVGPAARTKADAKAAKPHAKPAAPAKPATAAEPAKAQPARPAAQHKDPGAILGLPQSVAKAIGAHRTVVVFFYRRGVADDDATARSVSALHAKNLSVFKASPKQFGDYRRLVGGLDLSSLPATIIIGRDRGARVIEGFVDSRTLAQEVADSAR
jgi:hypothetical protein